MIFCDEQKSHHTSVTQSFIHHQHKEVVMKRTASILAAVAVTVLMGCQESNVTDPSATPMRETDPVSKAEPNGNSNIIILQATTDDAGKGEQYSVTGQVKYGLTQLPIMSQELFDVALDTQAKVTQLGSTERGWTVNNSSSERVNLTRRTSATVDKWYFLRGGPNSLYLHIQFDVTATTVSVNSITFE